MNGWRSFTSVKAGALEIVNMEVADLFRVGWFLIAKSVKGPR